MPDIFLVIGPEDQLEPNNIYLRTASYWLGFPTQFFGLKTYFQGAVQNLCLVSVADTPAGMGGKLFINKNGTTYGIYLVDTTDTNASPIRIKTTTGTKSIRKKT